MRRWTTVLAIGLVLWTAPASAQRGTPPSRRSLGELSAEVREICERYGVPYNSGPLGKQFGSVVRKICRLALPNRGSSDTARADLSGVPG